ncbi:MAG TPA: hypothetical protein VFP17_09690 [Solirubrobacterales bacterium]|nr:hypothetical protein [Solirubrobacterales bacterium]
MSKLIAVLAAAAAILMIVAGCGGGSDSSSDSASLSKAQFIKQADAICEKGDEEANEEVEAFAEENNVNTSKPTKKQQEDVITEVVAPNVQGQVEEISELGAPEGDEKQIEAMVDAVEEGVEELEADPSKLIEGKNPLGKGSKLAKEYGLKACGEEG